MAATKITTLPMSEAQFQTRILDYCALRGLLAFHSGDSRRDTSAGFPDLVIAGHNGVIHAELKTDKGRLSAEQQVWLDRLDEAGATAVVWRPADWPIIRDHLEAIR